MGGAAMTSSKGPVVGETRLFAKGNIRPLFLCGIAVFGAVLYGYDGTYWTGLLEMDKFKEDFGTPTVGSDGTVTVDLTSSQRAVLTSIIQAGEVVGALLAGPVGDRFGRRGGFFYAVFLLSLGSVLQLIIAGSVPLLGVGRAILGMGVGAVANSTPLYLGEVSPNAIRGAVVGSWQLLLSIGQVIGACVSQGTKDRTDTGAYRIPIGINLGFAMVLFIGTFILPESPRWLITKGRDEQALKSLHRINCGQPDPTAVIEAEYKSFVDAKREEDEMGKMGWGSLLHGVERRKLLIVCGTLIAQQISGVQFIFSYTTTFFANSGVTDAFLITIVVDIIQVVGVLCSFFLVNRFGRRPLILSTSVPMFIALFVCGGLGTIATADRNEAQNRCLISMICIYVFFFNLAWGPLAWSIASECAVGSNRQKLMSLGTACFFISAFVVAFTLPYLFDDDEAGLGAQIGWIYGVGMLLSMLFAWLVIPETLGRTLEEINEMINRKVPARKWTTYMTEVEAGGIVTDSSDIQKHSMPGSAASEGEEEADDVKPISKKDASTPDASEGTRADVRDA